MHLGTDENTCCLRVVGLDPNRERGAATLLTVSNGFAGVRGVFEEADAASSEPAVLLAGVYHRQRSRPEPPQAGDESPAPCPAPNWLALCLKVGDEQLGPEVGRVLAHERVLNLRRGWLIRRWRHQLPSGRIIRLVSLRCVSLADRHAFVQRVWLTVENDEPTRLRLVARLAAGPETVLPRHSKAPDLLVVRGSPGSPVVAEAQAGTLQVGRDHLPSRASATWEWQAEPGKTYRFDRLVSCWASRETADPAAEAVDHLGRLRSEGVESVLAAHRQRWLERWRASEVELDDDPRLQRGLRFAIAQLLSAANPDDDQVSIGARGLSSGQYRGHVLWETEVYLLPFFAYTWPAAARAILLYRYRTLDAARARAAELGYRGALYAWESAATGYETTPSRERGTNGEPVPILTGLHAHHISADVAYAVWGYWQATADDTFMLGVGAEIILETARFWASRADPDPDGAYHVRDVIGPDEHHERVDDSAYTNMLARFNLEIGQRTADWLQEEHPARWRALSARLRLGEAEVTQWGQVGDRLVLRHDPSTWLIEEFAGYFDLEDVDLGRFGSKVGRLEQVLGRAGLARTQIIKQPDVVLLCYLLWNRFGAAVARRNFAYYAPRCEAASSLSPSMHALVAARLGRLRAAERYLRQAAELDLDHRFEEPAEGIHIGNCGGVWQAVVFGLAGLRPAPTGLTFAPRLPAAWRSLRFPLQFRGRRLRTEVSGEALSVQLEAGEPLRLCLLGGPATTLVAGQRGTTRCADGRWQEWEIRRRRA